MIRKPIHAILAIATLGTTGFTAAAEETKSSAATEQSAAAKTKKEKIKDRRAVRKGERAEKRLAKKQDTAPKKEPQQVVPASAEADPAGRPRSTTPIVIVPPKPPTPAPVFSES